MKNKIFLPAVALCLALAGCDDDLGNYTYKDINEVSVSQGDELKDGALYEKYAFIDHFKFSPKLESSLGAFNESDYEYEWRVMPQGEDFANFDSSKIVIGREKDIDEMVTLNPGMYSCFYFVKDKKTGVEWGTRFSLRVKTITNEGWLVLADVNGYPRLDVLHNKTADEDMIARDIFQDSEIELGSPRRIMFGYTLQDPDAILVTDKGTFKLDKYDLHASDGRNLKWDFGTPPEKIVVDASVKTNYSGRKVWAVIDEENELYVKNLSTWGSFFEFSMNRVNGKDKVKLAPYFGACKCNEYYANNMDGCIPVVLYDQTNKQFLQIGNEYEYPVPMEFSSYNKFSNPTGRDMVFMESTRQGYIKALLKDPSDNGLYYYSMTLRGKEIPGQYWWDESTYIAYNDQEDYCKVNGPELDKAEHFAFHHFYEYLFYSVGNRIYQFRLSDPGSPAELVATLPGEEISVLKFNAFEAWEAYTDWEKKRGYDLIVGSNVLGKDNAECGIFRSYEIPAVMGTAPVTEKKKVEGFGKIVDIVYKERAK